MSQDQLSQPASQTSSTSPWSKHPPVLKPGMSRNEWNATLLEFISNEMRPQNPTARVSYLTAAFCTAWLDMIAAALRSGTPEFVVMASGPPDSTMDPPNTPASHRSVGPEQSLSSLSPGFATSVQSSPTFLAPQAGQRGKGKQRQQTSGSGAARSPDSASQRSIGAMNTATPHASPQQPQKKRGVPRKTNMVDDQEYTEPGARPAKKVAQGRITQAYQNPFFSPTKRTPRRKHASLNEDDLAENVVVASASTLTPPRLSRRAEIQEPLWPPPGAPVRSAADDSIDSDFFDGILKDDWPNSLASSTRLSGPMGSMSVLEPSAEGGEGGAEGPGEGGERA